MGREYALGHATLVFRKSALKDAGFKLRESALLVLLGKWILENNPNGRVVIVTDRDELDKSH